jgi:hypothetical protein
VDAELVKLTDECIKAEQKWCDPDHIVDLMDWNKEGKLPRGYKKAKREADKAYRDYKRLRDQIAETRATTFDGMLTKVHCARGFKIREIDSIDRGSPAEVMALSIIEDLGSADTPAVAAFFADEPLGPIRSSPRSLSTSASLACFTTAFIHKMNQKKSYRATFGRRS